MHGGALIGTGMIGKKMIITISAGPYSHNHKEENELKASEIPLCIKKINLITFLLSGAAAVKHIINKLYEIGYIP